MIRTLTICLLAAGLASAGEPTSAQNAFENLKKLTGEWTGTNSSGEAVTARYRLTGGGTVLVEDFEFVKKANSRMTTMYHLDGDRVMLTHYCMVGNQPRMAARVADGDTATLRFEFVDASNMATPETGHMHSAVLKLLGADRMSAAWTFRQGGRDTHTEAIEYQRVR